MNQFNPFSILGKAAEAVEENIGTVESPILLSRAKTNAFGEIRDAGKVLTGKAARASEASRWTAWAAQPQEERSKDAFFPLGGRQERRSQARAEARQRRKGQRNFVRRERAKEVAARDLLNLFLLADGAEPASPLHRNRAKDRIAERVAYLRGEQQAKYDEAIAARQADRSLGAPQPIASHEEIRAELWRLAQTAVLPTPKRRAA